MPSNSTNVVKWRWTTSESFSVKSLYTFLQDSGVREDRFTRLWQVRTPLKVKIFEWLLLRSRLPTKENLLRRGWSGDAGCVLYGNDMETADYLFLTCPTTRSLLLDVTLFKRALCSFLSARGLWDETSRKGGSLRRRELETLITMWWVIWKERNCRTFESKSCSSRQLLSAFRSYRSLWSSHRH